MILFSKISYPTESVKEIAQRFLEAPQVPDFMKKIMLLCLAVGIVGLQVFETQADTLPQGLDYMYVQQRNYESGNTNNWLYFSMYDQNQTPPGNVLASATLYDPNGEVVNIPFPTYAPGNLLMGNYAVNNGKWNFSSGFDYFDNGYNASFDGDLIPGVYRLQVTTINGYTDEMTFKVSAPVECPIISSSSFHVWIDQSDNLVWEWALPSIDPGLYTSISAYMAADGDDENFFWISVPTDVNRITIPKTTFDLLKARGDNIRMMLSLRINDEFGNNFQRNLSNSFSLSLTSSFIFNNSEYKLTTETSSWFDAEAEAIAWGGHLVTINDQAEQDWLVSTFGTDNFWIGFNDIEEEGTWVWTSGEEVTYTNWAQSEPNNFTGFGDGEDIAVMYWGSVDGVQWNDLSDFGENFGIMERPVPKPIKATVVLTANEPDYTVTAGSDTLLYGTFSSNQITLESGTKAELINFPGQNSIQIRSRSDLFSVSRSGTIVTFEGSDGTSLKIPATNSVQTFDFSDQMPMTLSIHGGQVLLDDQVVTTTPASIENSQVEPVACGAYVAPNVWKEFDCYNLAAIGKDSGDDPFTPSWRLIGGYWQWGRKGPDPSQWYDNNTEHFAHGPTGPTAGEANEGAISDWDQTEASDSAWSDSYKTVSDPCPVGYRVPTIIQWEGVHDNNTQSIVGTWSDSATNYSSARFFGDTLMLPTAGYHGHNRGALSYRGYFGSYWSTSQGAGYYAWDLSFSSSYACTSSHYRRNGFSVRCVAE